MSTLSSPARRRIFPGILLRPHLVLPCFALGMLALGCGDGDNNSPVDQGMTVTDTGPLEDLGPGPTYSGTAPAGPWFEVGDDGVADPRIASPTQALAGRAAAGMLPDYASELQVWETGDFILANDRVALVIEDVGPSDLYDPWGGRPVGMARIQGGELFEPADFGEFFILLGRQSIMTEHVGVVNDGTDGNAAVVRAQGRGAYTPFLEALAPAQLLRNDFRNIPTAIDYVLEPGAEHVDIYLTFQNYNDFGANTGGLKGFMFGARMPRFNQGHGFNVQENTALLAFEDEDATSWAYSVPGQSMAAFLSVSGFTGMSSEGTVAVAGEETRWHYARLYIGGRGLEGVLAAQARAEGLAVRTITGTVFENDGTTPAAGVRVHAEELATDGAVYITHTLTADDGTYSVTVPAASDARLRTFRQGDRVAGPDVVPSGTNTHDFTQPASGFVQVLITDLDSGAATPGKIHIVPAGSSSVPTVPGRFGERAPTNRLHEAYATGQDGEPIGQRTLRVPVGDWEVIVGRGPEYDVVRQSVSVAATDTNAAPVIVNAALERVVETPGVMCADFHIHTARSNDASPHPSLSMQRAVADGLEIPARSEHEYVEPLDPLIVDMGLGAWAYGLSSVELSTMEFFGHFGVIPIEVSNGVNGGTPQWVTYPSATNPSADVTLLTPPELFESVRARPEAPAIVINHPRGGTNYFDYAGFDRDTGMISNPDAWDFDFTMVEVFNGSGWRSNRDGTVRDWFTLISSGRPMFAVGSSDAHGLALGYPRTCLEVGTDDPRSVTPNAIRDAARDGHSTVVGGVFIDALHGGSAGPGDTVSGVGASTTLDVRVQAATWITGDFVMDVIVDGVVSETIDLPEGAVERYMSGVTVNVAPAGSWVVLAVYSPTGATLSPIDPGREAFGVTNPIWFER